MASVPNTTTFSLTDVIAAITGSQNDLVECFAEADSGAFNPLYGSISDNDMLAFRDYEESVASTLTVSPTSMNFLGASSSQSATVTSNTTWTVTDSATWINVTGASGSGNDTFLVNVDANIGGTRFGSVTVRTTDLSITRTISVVQQGFA